MLIDYIWARSRNIFGDKHLHIYIYVYTYIHTCMYMRAHVLLYCFGTCANMIYPCFFLCFGKVFGVGPKDTQKILKGPYGSAFKGGGYGGGGCVRIAWHYYYYYYYYYHHRHRFR